MIIDAKDLVLGRMASEVAKRLLDGKEIIIVNAGKAIISGRKKSTISEYEAWTKIRNLVNPAKGPFHPKLPADIVRRTVRGMLPMKKTKGRKAYQRLRVIPGTPDDFRAKEKKSIRHAHIKNLRTRRFIRIEELSKHLGRS